MAFIIYIINFTSFGATLVFYMAIFPRLARCTARTLEMRDKLRMGQVSKHEYDVEESMEKNRISNISTVRERGSPLRWPWASLSYICCSGALHNWIRCRSWPQCRIAHTVEGSPTCGQFCHCVVRATIYNACPDAEFCRMTVYAVVVGGWWCACWIIFEACICSMGQLA